ncbi:MAG TPA: hypothetical protein VHU23_03285 [Rhizomicrobium sp.]|nr:hypothetical protein [Rhizomicrobium sp.]
MAGSRPVHRGLFLPICFAVLGMAGRANAGSTATRCDAQGCVHIHCNATGDRCYRYSDAPSALGEHYPRRSVGAREPHRVCDNNGDRCYSSQGRRWDFRQYYRELGYRWDAEPR